MFSCEKFFNKLNYYYKYFIFETTQTVVDTKLYWMLFEKRFIFQITTLVVIVLLLLLVIGQWDFYRLQA